jgi:hypothetical protein
MSGETGPDPTVDLATFLAEVGRVLRRAEEFACLFEHSTVVVGQEDASGSPGRFRPLVAVLARLFRRLVGFLAATIEGLLRVAPVAAAVGTFAF